MASEDETLSNLGGNGFGGAFSSHDDTVPMLGVNNLQRSIDQFGRDVNKLDSVANKMTGQFQGGTSSYGHFTASPQQMAASVPGQPNFGHGFMGQLGGMGLPVLGPTSQIPPQTAAGGAGTPNGGGPTFGGAPPGGGPPGGPGGPVGPAGSGGGPGSSGYGPGMRRAFGRYMPGYGYTRIGPLTVSTRMGGTLGGVLGVAGAISGMGERETTTQINMSSFVQQQQLMAPGNFTGQAFANAARFQAFGGRNRNLNAIAFSPDDAAAGQMLINQFAGATANRNGGYSNGFGRAAGGAANMFGYTNPNLGFAGSAALTQQFYSPQVSLRMRMLGYNTTPLSFTGGNPASSTRVISSLMQRMFNGPVSQRQLAFSLREGGIGRMDLAQIFGNNPALLDSITSTMLAQNRLSTGAGGNPRLNQPQIQRLFNQAGKGEIDAQNTMERYGINRSDIQNIKNAQAAKTGTSADIANSFNAGLQAATTSLTGFRKVLDDIARTPFGQAGAYGGGFMGALGRMANPGGLLSLGGSVAQIMMLRRLGALGGAASAAGAGAGGIGAGTAAVTSATAGAGAATAARGLLGRIGPTAAFMATLWAANNIHVGKKSLWQMGDNPQQHNSFGSMFSTGKGANWMNSWAMFGKDLIDPGNWFEKLTSNNPRQTSMRLAKDGPMQAAPGGTRSSGGHKPPGGDTKSKATSGVSAAAITAVTDAKKQLGTPYQFGGEKPGVGFDCSGLVQWSYGQAGVGLPRTSQSQYAATKARSIDPSKAQEGDLVFQAGSDGSPNSPGHVAMMVNHTQIIEAPHTGLNVRVRAYSPKEWSHVTRPTGGLLGFGGPLGPIDGTGSGGANGTQGNHGLSASSGGGIGIGSYGSSEEIDNVTAALLGGIGGGGGAPTLAGSTGGRGGKKSTGAGNVPTKGGIGTASSNQAYAKSLMSKFGWGPLQWGALKDLWTGESGWSSTAWNRSGAYGVAQALGHGKGFGAVGPRSIGSNKPGMNEAYGTQYGLTPAQARAANAGSAQPQILWGEGYIKQRYNDPQTALYMWNSRSPHWYAQGTNYAMPGMAWVGERGPELRALNSGDQIFSATQSHDQTQAAKRPAEGPWRAMMPNGLHKTQPDNQPCKIDVKLNVEKIEISGHHASPDKMANDFLNVVTRRLQNDKTIREIAAGHTHG